MRYNWHPIAGSGSLPNRFQHSLVYIKDEASNISKVYAFGSREEDDKGLEVFELDSKLENWNLTPPLFDNEATRKLMAAKRRPVAAAFGAFVYVFGGFPGGVLRFDTVEHKWCVINITGACVDLSHVTAATALGKNIALFFHRNGANIIYLFSPATQRFVSPQSLGISPSLKSVYIAARLENEKVLVHDDSSDNLWYLEAILQGGEAVAWSKCRRDTTPVVICGPSGVGKGTVISMLMKEFPDKSGFSVSHTTRKPRENEIDGVHYHFTSREAMELAVQEGKFLEHAHVHGNIYGTSIAAVEAVSHAGKRCILDIDVQGAMSVKKSPMHALFIFIAPPSFEELERRLRGRGTETEEQVMKRLQTAKREIQLAEEELLFDYTLVNDNLEQTYKQLKAILGLAENTSTACLKLITLQESGRSSHEVLLADTSGTTETIKGLRLEPKEKPVPGEFNQVIHLSDLELLMTSPEGGSIVVRVGK